MRAAGVLLHISSLYNKRGIGTLGHEAYKFIDFLAKAKQTFWQILPINPTSFGDSPYQSPSTFAFNPYFIDFDLLYEDGLISKSKIKNSKGIDYCWLFENKISILKSCYKYKYKVEKEYEMFLKKNSFWINDYAIYSVLKEKNGYKPWYLWNDELKYYNKKLIKNLEKENFIDFDKYRFIQYLFYRQYQSLKKYAKKKKISIIGDIPIYVAYDSVDVWINPKMFELNEKLEMTYVAGCPPDDFCEDGQLWGNPLYNWDYLKQTNYLWWKKRINAAKKLYDLIRIDHFRGFAGYYKIPNGQPAKKGFWVKGVGIELFKVLNTNRIIAENLGFLDKSVHILLAQTGYPGMHITQFEFGKEQGFKKDFKENNVIYTSTHDNMSIRTWYESLEEKETVIKACNIKNEPYLDIIKATMNKKPFIAIIPLADYLGSLKRMNEPSTKEGNWLYQIDKNDLSDKTANIIKEITILTKRENQK